MMSRILIIEDEISIAELEKDYLELSGFEVEIEENGARGLERSLEEDFDIDAQFLGERLASAQGRVLTGAMDAHNTFEAPQTIQPASLNVAVTDTGLQFKLPAKSVVVITAKA